MKIRQPIADDREQHSDQEEIREADEKISEDEGKGPVEAVGAVFAEGLQVFDGGGNVGDGHEGHEGAAEEDGVGEGLDGGLVVGEAEPGGACGGGLSVSLV